MTAIGQNLQRVDGVEKVTGKALYTGDLKVAGMLHGKLLRSPLAHALVRSIDTSKAASMAGVRVILTRENIPLESPILGIYLKDQPIVALDKVHYAGDVVAAVGATDEAAAEEALGKIEVDYEELPAVMTVHEALKKDAPLVHPNLERPKKYSYGEGASYHIHEKTNIAHHYRYERGDIEKGFAESDYVFEHTFKFSQRPALSHGAGRLHGAGLRWIRSPYGLRFSLPSNFRISWPATSSFPSAVSGSLSHTWAAVTADTRECWRRTWQ